MQQDQRLSFTMEEAAAATGFTRSRLYQAMATGELRTIKAGRQRLVSRGALEEYVAKLERDSAGRAA